MSAMNNWTAERWVRELGNALTALRHRSDIPAMDIEWLLLRCRDTGVYTGQLLEASVQQLFKDVTDFEREFPGLLPAELVRTASGPVSER